MRTDRSLLLTVAAVGALLSGCAGVPARTSDGTIEKPLEAVTGRTTADVQKASKKKVLDLWDVYTLAVERTETLASGAENILQAEAQSRQAVGTVLPQVFLNGSRNWQSNTYIGGGSPAGTAPPNGGTVYLSGAETILSGLNQVAAIAGAGANVDAQKAGLRNQSRLLLLDVANAFYNVLALEESLDALQTARELNEKILEVEKKWEKMGRSRKASVSNTQAQLAQTLADIENDKELLDQARLTLSTLANIRSDKALKSSESYDPPALKLDPALSAVDQRPDVRNAKAAVALADSYLLQAHGEHLPSLSVQGKYYLQQDGGTPNPDWNLQLVASLPLFEGGEIVALEDQMASRKRQAEMQLSLVRRTAADDIRQAFKSLNNSIGEAKAYQTAVQAYENAYQNVWHDYKLNLTTNLELLQTQSSLENTRIGYVKAKYQALYDRVWLGVATGEFPKTGNSSY